ncbi:MAG: hypothetical protein ACSHYF_03590 [Verrucomicrobiaceae bacterium]
MATGIDRGFQTGPLNALAPFSPDPEAITVTPLNDGLEKVTLSLPPDFGPFIRQTVSLP